MRNIYLHSLKVIYHKILIDYKRKNSNFTVEKSDRHHLHQVTKANIISNSANQHYVSLDNTNREDYIISMIFLPKCVTQIIRKTGQMQTERCYTK